MERIADISSFESLGNTQTQSDMSVFNGTLEDAERDLAYKESYLADLLEIQAAVHEDLIRRNIDRLQEAWDKWDRELVNQNTSSKSLDKYAAAVKKYREALDNGDFNIVPD